MGHIALIGPIGVGKSTIAPIVGARLRRPVIDLDDMRAELYATLGYDDAAADDIYRRDGVGGLIRYWKPFEIDLVEHVVAREPDAVLDFGAGHSHYEDEGQQQRAAAALAGHHVVLLLPSTDLAWSERFLAARQPEEHRATTLELNRVFLRSPSNAMLAGRVVLTGEREPEEIADDVVGGLQPAL
jgi:shikimate kinase